ncbi:MAG: hypothetical protein O9302_01405 [Cyclobacteriaceae bacterium]|jgi:hypothetical protein|nr:hypothetical protein [Flammeovirgaceae bacterium]MCZ8023046.1 hypothetical protein [Cytophagales bacterium]MCZ8326688.1 hypothetical protein [Cyclobacteriaceae bacterium]
MKNPQQQNQNQNRNQDKKENQNQNANASKRRFNRFNHNRQPKSLKRTLQNKGLDLLVVFIALVLALGVWQGIEKYQQTKREEDYKQLILADLNKDLEEIKKNGDNIRKDYETVIQFVQQFASGSALNDSLASVIVSALSIDQFNGNSGAFQAFQAGETFSNSSIAFQRAAEIYYHRYQTLIRFEDNYNDFSQSMNAYFSPYCNYTLKRITNKAVLEKEETKNNLLLIASYLETGIEAYEEALKDGQKLKEQLTK